MSNERDLLGEVRTRRSDDLGIDTKEFIPSASDGIFTTSTPRSKRSVSYLDMTRVHEGDDVSLSSASWQRMRGVSQSISDLNVLREKQMGRRCQSSILFEDNFLEEHAKRLQEARLKIKALEAKYCHPNRLRSYSNLSTELRSRDLASHELNDTTKQCEEIDGHASSLTADENPNNIHKELKETKEESVDKPKDTELQKEIVRGSLFEELSEDRSDLDSGISADRPAVVNCRSKTQTRPVTWAFDEDFHLSVSSQGPNWHEPMAVFQEEGRRNGNERSHGYTDMDFGHKPSSNPNTPKKTKWQSMPSLGTNHDEFTQDRQMMYGEAIPVDPDDTRQNRNKKHGRKSGLYMVNVSPEKENQQQNKKQKFRKKLFHKRGSLKKFSLKYTTVGAPQEAQSIGRIVGLHPTTENAYTIELNRPESGSYGFRIQRSYQDHKKGIFISKITDKRAHKFFAGLLNVGDEVLEINNTNLQDQNYSTANKLIKNSDKLVLTILPYSSRKDE